MKKPAWEKWTHVSNYSTIQSVALNDKLYLLGRANNGMHTWSFDPQTYEWDFISKGEPAWEWTDVSNYSTIQSVALKNKLYLLGRANNGMHTWCFDPQTRKWEQVAADVPDWKWTHVSNYSTIQSVVLKDKLYLLGRANNGMHTWCFDPQTRKWEQVAADVPDWKWSKESNYSTIQSVALKGKLYLLGRANNGMHTWCFDPQTRKWEQVAADVPDWKWTHVSNYSTIQSVVLKDKLYLSTTD